MAFIGYHFPVISVILGYVVLQAVLSLKNASAENPHRFSRSVLEDGRSPLALPQISVQNDTVATLLGIRVEKYGAGEEYSETNVDKQTGVVSVVADTSVTLRLFGQNFSPNTRVAFTKTLAPQNARCSADISASFRPDDTNNASITSHSALFTVQLPLSNSNEPYFFCIGTQPDEYNGAHIVWIHQGTEKWLQIHADKLPALMPLWLQIICIVLLLTLSGLFSGLNLGLMTLDPTELKIVLNCGSLKEQSYAKSILPLRKKGNFLLCTLLLGNVLVNTTLTILLDDLTSGIIAVIGSTISIVVFGEIIPQALCSRHGMAVGAHTIWLTKFFMIITFPLSYPISRILDCILGAEIGHVYNRERLMELIKVTHGYNDLEQEEVNIISGALELKKKKVGQIMTPLNDVFMIPYDAVLDFDTVSEIMRQGYTRVPVFDGSRTNVVALLNIKDLALVDPDDNTPVKTLCKFYNHHVRTVFDDTTLDVMLDEFKQGRSHMAFVQRVTTEDESDPFYETVGVVTLEDVIEEIIQSEIEDEMDTTADNRRRMRRRDAALAQQDLPVFSASGPQYQSLITPQLQMATFQFLSTTLEPFKEELIAPTILRRLLRHAEVARFLKVKPEEADPPCLYTAGKPADCFIMILEGRVEVKVGNEHLLFQSGPFTYFGISVLNAMGDLTTPMQSSPLLSEKMHLGPGGPFIPDFTVYPVTDLLYLCITRAQYVAAFRASLVERTGKTDGVRDDVDFAKALQIKRQSIATVPDGMPMGRNSLLANSNVSLNEIHLRPKDVIEAAAETQGLLSPPPVDELHMESETKDGRLNGAVPPADKFFVSGSALS